MTITRVYGIESHLLPRNGLLDTDDSLEACRHCGAPVGFRKDNPGLDGMLRAECSNTSCAIATPFHYKTREDAAYAWNRKPGDLPKRPEKYSSAAEAANALCTESEFKC